MVHTIIQQAIADQVLSHAYLIRSSSYSDELHATLLSLVGGDASKIALLNEEQLTVSRSRELREVASRAASGAQVMVIQFLRATSQAQNALLKAIEEPQPGVHIFILAPRTTPILPTITSRCIELFDDSGVPVGYRPSLVGVSYDVRKKTVDHILKVDDVRGKAVGVLTAELAYLHQQREGREHLKSLSWALGLLEQPGTSPKLILEHLIAIL